MLNKIRMWVARLMEKEAYDTQFIDNFNKVMKHLDLPYTYSERLDKNLGKIATLVCSKHNHGISYTYTDKNRAMLAIESEKSMEKSCLKESHK